MIADDGQPPKKEEKVVSHKWEKEPVVKSNISPIPPQEKVVKEEKKEKKGKSGNKKYTRVVALRDGSSVVVDDKGQYWSVSADADVVFERNKANISINNLVACYDWADEIDQMLPSREEMVDNVRRSIMRAGGTYVGAGNPRRYLATAFNMYALDLSPKEEK